MPAGSVTAGIVCGSSISGLAGQMEAQLYAGIPAMVAHRTMHMTAAQRQRWKREAGEQLLQRIRPFTHGVIQWRDA